ncbi:MAG TPA: 2-amino-4-hydroxy-6-hydroxymethyldihydropteridine diphosphokinase [Capsulimonadaceae bacterium]|nr:2-amino-4-hydroxy-6-hydroxymethyldihydropteridine diphosphokinase [Capsulimonadaceae bacterium]
MATARQNVAYLALGGNIGDVEAGINAALKALRRPPIIEIEARSSIYRTEPVGGPPGQPDYLNAAVRVRTGLDPDELLDVCLGIERSLGRVRRTRWGPRPIDIDLLLYGARQIAREGLVVPHPRMRERLFVLAPLAEIAEADLKLPPDGEPLGTALDKALAAEQTTIEEYRGKIVSTRERA